MFALLHVVAAIILAANTVDSIPYYSIWPCDIKDNTTNSQITVDLQQHFDSNELFISHNVNQNVLFWDAPLDDAQKDYYSHFPGVHYVAQSGTAAPGMRLQTVGNEIDRLLQDDATRLKPRSTKTKRKDIVQLGIMNKTLKILPLGDSITDGFQSTSGNGYRLDLLNKLIPSNNVTYIGSSRAGNMTNNQNEGHNGALITDIANYTIGSLKERPNLVLLHAGTNDVNGPVEPDTAPERLGNLVDQVITACPDAALLVAQIVPSGNAATEARILKFNKAITDVVGKRAEEGKHVLLVDMFNALNTSIDFTDYLHPNDQGYKKMADTWYDSINVANSNGWINEPFGEPDSASGNLQQAQTTNTPSSAASCLNIHKFAYAALALIPLARCAL